MKKTKLIALVLCMALICGLLVGCGAKPADNGSAPADPAAADKAEEPANDTVYEFTVATRAAEGDLVAASVKWFADEIESRTDGRIKLDIQYNGVLCSQGTEFDALESGICDIAVASLSSNIDRWPSLGWVIVPGMFSTYTQQSACLKAVQEAGYIDGDMEKNDVQVLWWQPAECFNFALTKTKVESLDDLKGLKIGYAGGSDIANVLNTIGATAVGTNPADFYMSLSTGVIDGFVNPARYMYDAQFYEVVDYMPVGIACGASNNSVYMSNSAFNSLPDDLKEIFKAVCAEAGEHFLNNAAELYSNEYELLTEAGCECYDLSDDVIAEYTRICTELSENWVTAQNEAGNDKASEIRNLIVATAAAVD